MLVYLLKVICGLFSGVVLLYLPEMVEVPNRIDDLSQNLAATIVGATLALAAAKPPRPRGLVRDLAEEHSTLGQVIRSTQPNELGTAPFDRYIANLRRRKVRLQFLGLWAQVSKHIARTETYRDTIRDRGWVNQSPKYKGMWNALNDDMQRILTEIYDVRLPPALIELADTRFVTEVED